LISLVFFKAKMDPSLQERLIFLMIMVSFLMFISVLICLFHISVPKFRPDTWNYETIKMAFNIFGFSCVFFLFPVNYKYLLHFIKEEKMKIVWFP
jgi:hypothetical protein